MIHSRAFRRLEYKTQVFLNGTGDHLRTRLTHTMEVAAIARGIARALLAEGVGALECELVELDVDASNGSARAFYGRLGFREQSARLIAPSEALA